MSGLLQLQQGDIDDADALIFSYTIKMHILGGWFLWGGGKGLVWLMR